MRVRYAGMEYVFLPGPIECNQTLLLGCVTYVEDSNAMLFTYQVFEQMMQAASERMPAPPPPPPPGTPARRLSSCVVARDGGGEFFAQSPAPGRPASFFRCDFYTQLPVLMNES